MNQIKIADYTELKLIAWSYRPEDFLDEDDVFALYERNWAYVHQEKIEPKEQELITYLTHKYGHGVMNV